MRISKIDHFKHHGDVASIASIYQQAFGGEPWNEGYLCPVCEKSFALKVRIETCPECEKEARTVLVVKYWPTSKVISDFYHEMKKPDSVCVVATEESKIIGFAWGYRVTSGVKLDKYLDAPGLHKKAKGDFFYLDECALTPNQQGKGIGKSLTKQIFREQHQEQVILRTKAGSRMHTLVGHLGGEVIQHISRERVVMKLSTPA